MVGGEHFFSSLDVAVWNKQYLEDSEQKDELLNEPMPYEAIPIKGQTQKENIIRQVFIILSDKVPEFGQDDCWLFVSQYSFASQRWKLGENMH